MKKTLLYLAFGFLFTFTACTEDFDEINVKRKIEKDNSAHNLKRKLIGSEISVKIVFD